MFLGLYSLMEAVRIAPAHHEAAGEFVDNHYFALVRDDIVFVADEQLVRLQRLLNVVVEVGIFNVAEVLYVEESLCLLGAVFGYGDRLILAVDDIVPTLHVL